MSGFQHETDQRTEHEVMVLYFILQLKKKKDYFSNLESCVASPVS